MGCCCVVSVVVDGVMLMGCCFGVLLMLFRYCGKVSVAKITTHRQIRRCDIFS